MKTTVSKIEGKVAFDAKYIFRLGVRASLFCRLRAKHWNDEELRDLEISRYLLAGAHQPEKNVLSDKIFKLERAYLCKLEKIADAELDKEITLETA
jgi:hypothetical protein